MDSRRSFLRKSCSLCLAVAGASALAASLESCSSIPLVKANSVSGKITVPLSSFVNTPYVLVRTKQLDFDLLLVKQNEKYHALLMQCTHHNEPLTVNSSVINCASHGSQFDLTGKVTKSPASRDLTRYPAVVENNNVIISI